MTFVVLHYVTEEDTLRCVDSILHLKDPDTSRVIVVDNASPNGSGARLEERYRGHSRVRVVFNRENLGYARGLNVGYRLAKQEGASFVTLMNNDIEVVTRDGCERIADRFQRQPFDILGPDIVSTATGKHQNPRRVFFDTPAKVAKNLRFLRLVDVLGRVRMDGPFLKLYETARAGRDRLRARSSMATLPPAPKPEAGGVLGEDWMLFGACWVFSPRFLARYDGLDEGTFLYLEEELMKFTARRDGLVMVYDPDVVVRHAEQSSTRASFASEGRRERIRRRHLIHSNRVLLARMRGAS